MRWMVLLTLLSRFLLLGFFPQQISALSDASVTFKFRQELTIQAIFSTDQPVQKAQLNLQPQGGEIQQVDISLPVGNKLDIQVDLQKVPLPPFARIYYWFVFLYQDGSSFTSPSYWFDYIDNRFQWTTATDKWFNLYWVSKGSDESQNIQAIALSSLKNATATLPVSPDLPISIFIYPDAKSLQDAVNDSTNSEIIGNARIAENVILVSLTDDLTNTTNLERQIPHEMTHLLEYRLSGANYSSVPAWMLEGLATNAENYKDPDQARLLKIAVQQNALIPLDNLCSTFPREAGQTSLAYAESASFTTFLTNKYGTTRLINMLQNAGNGLSCQQLVQNTFGQNLPTLETEWHQKLSNSGLETFNLFAYWPVVLVILILCIPLFFIRKRQHPQNVPGESHDNRK